MVSGSHHTCVNIIEIKCMGVKMCHNVFDTLETISFRTDPKNIENVKTSVDILERYINRCDHRDGKNE